MLQEHAVKLREARTTDVPQILELVNQYAQKKEMLPLSPQAVFSRLRHFMVAEYKGRVIGCGSLQIFWDDLAEIRSLAIAAEHQGNGLGSLLVRHLLELAGGLCIRRVFTLTLHPQFFEKLGFVRIQHSELPQKVWSDCIHCSYYLQCREVALIRTLSD